MLYTENFSLHHYVGFLQIRSYLADYILLIKICTHMKSTCQLVCTDTCVELLNAVCASFLVSLKLNFLFDMTLCTITTMACLLLN